PVCPQFLLLLLTSRPPPRSTLFPYTTLFRSSMKPSSAGRAGYQACSGALRRARTEDGARIDNRARAACPGRRARDNQRGVRRGLDRKSTRLNSSHVAISYAVFCLKKKKIRPH